MSKTKDRNKWGHTVETVRFLVEYDIEYTDEPGRNARQDAIRFASEMPRGGGGAGPNGSYGVVSDSQRVEFIGGQVPGSDDLAARLRAYLRAINACQDLENMVGGGLWPYSGSVVNGLYSFKNKLGECYETNEELQKFDQVFTSAGWANRGLRWHREEPDDPEDIFVVQFTNDQHTTWETV